MSGPADRTHANELARARAAYRKRVHRCVSCNAQDAYTLAGRSRCAECAEKMNARKRKVYWERGGNQPERNEKCVALRREWDSKGLCTKCGHRPSLPGRRRCVECAAYDKRYKERKRIERGNTLERKIERKEHGFCWFCGEPVADIKKSVSDENVKLCETHYKTVCECAKIGSMAYVKKYGETWARRTKNQLWPHKTKESRWTDGTQPSRPEQGAD